MSGHNMHEQSEGLPDLVMENVNLERAGFLAGSNNTIVYYNGSWEVGNNSNNVPKTNPNTELVLFPFTPEPPPKTTGLKAASNPLGPGSLPKCGKKKGYASIYELAKKLAGMNETTI